MKPFYITTAIDYANGAPHLGHAYEKVLTDVISRTRRMRGDTVYFLTGLDEHGQKVQQTAERQGIEPQAFCDTTAEAFKGLCEKLEIQYDDYIRTTEPRHKTVVQGILQDLFDKGVIYKAEYKGFYSARAEQFLQEKDKVDGTWPEIFGEVTEITEENYFFKLSEHQDWLAQYIKDNEDFIFPKFRAKQVLEFLKEPLNDLCISRPKERLSWGIEPPFDSGYVTYVWFDALINYISAVGYGTDRFKEFWPADYHVIGKDILVPAHAVYWPIMLHAIGVEMPKTLVVHGWWMSSGSKMSKSTGNVVNPLDLAEEFGADAFRYFLLREMNVGQDSDFSEELFLTRYNVLANDLGNLVSRLLNMGHRYCEGVLPEASVNEAPEEELKVLWEDVSAGLPALFDELQFHTALEQIFKFVRGVNRYAEVRAPWKLAKSEDPKDRALLETSLFYMAEGLRLASLALAPVIPGTAEKIHELLGQTLPTVFEGHFAWSDCLEGAKLGEKTILFPRREKKES